MVGFVVSVLSNGIFLNHADAQRIEKSWNFKLDMLCELLSLNDIGLIKCNKPS